MMSEAEIKEFARNIKATGQFIDESATELSQIGNLNEARNELMREIKNISSKLTNLESNVTSIKTEFTEMKTDITQIKSEFTEMKTDITQIKSEIPEMKFQIDLNFIQSEENTNKRLFNSLLCLTQDSKIAWIQMGYDVMPEMPKNLYSLRNAHRNQITVICHYYKIPPSESLIGDKQAIAEFVGVQNIRTHH